MSPTTTTGYAHRATLRNDRPHPLDVYVETWGSHLAMPPGAAFDVVARSALEGALEVSVDEGGMTVYGWSGATFDVRSADGRLLVRSGVPVP